MNCYLRDWRMARGLSQEAAAYALQISQAKLSRLERRAVRVTLDDVEQLAIVYQTTPHDLLFCPPDIPRNSPQD